MASASQIDPTVFPDNQKVKKSDLREQFTIAHNEITTLLQAVELPRKTAFSNNEFNSL